MEREPVYHLVGSKSSQNIHPNGATLRVRTIQAILTETGHEEINDLKVFKKFHGGILVLGSIGAFRKILFRSVKPGMVWLDVCDTWIGSRFGRQVGMRSRILGLLEITLLFILMKRFNRKLFVTFISERDKDKDGLIFNSFQRFVVPNDIEAIEVGASEGTRFIFSGDAHFFPNRKAVKELTKALETQNWNLMRILIFGEGWEKIASNNFFEIMPFSPVETLYMENYVHLVPVSRGYGIKNKLVIPLALGLRVICHENNLVGVFDNQNITSTNDISKFPEIMNTVLKEDFKYTGKVASVYKSTERSDLIAYIMSGFGQIPREGVL